jgi:uncharacterized protein
MLVTGHRHPDGLKRSQELPHLAGNLVDGAHTAVLLREHSVRQICTRDMDFHKFKFLEVLDPVQS